MEIEYTRQHLVVLRAEVGNLRVFIGPHNLVKLEGWLSVRIYDDRGILVYHLPWAAAGGNYSVAKAHVTRWLRKKGHIQ